MISRIVDKKHVKDNLDVKTLDSENKVQKFLIKTKCNFSINCHQKNDNFFFKSRVVASADLLRQETLVKAILS